MKKIIFLILFQFSIVFAQTQKSTVYGLKGGLNNSILRGKELDGSKTGFTGYEVYGALFSDTSLSKKFNFENELLFSYTDDYNFIEFPLHIKYKCSQKVNVFIGPKLDFIADNDNENFERGYRFKNFGVSTEIGTQYNLTKRFFAEVRYSKSFTKQVDDLVLEIYGGKRNTIRLGLGIKF